jgi:hypothetical protein
MALPPQTPEASANRLVIASKFQRVRNRLRHSLGKQLAAWSGLCQISLLPSQKHWDGC